MRFAGFCFFLVAASLAPAQTATIRTTVPLGVAPASVIDRHGKPIAGLEATDFLLFDEGQPRDVKLAVTDDGDLPPVAAVIIVQTSDIALSALGKIRKTGSLMGNAIAGERGETAVVTFDNEIRVVREFTANADDVTSAFEELQPADNGGGRMIDAASLALDMLAAHPGPHRLLVVVIGESKDRGSKVKLEALLEKAGHSATTIYGVTYSAYVTPFTTKADEYQPPDGGGLIKAIGELARTGKINTVERLTEATGGQRFGFATRSKLEKNIIRLGADLHNRYVLTFRPDTADAATYRRISLQVKGRPDAIVKVRSRYWAGK